MAESQFYASVYVGSLQVDLDSYRTTEAFRKSMNSALPEFYAAVLVFSTRARGYFKPSGLVEPPCPPLGNRLRLLHVLTLHLAKLTNYVKPFSIALGPCLQGIDATKGKLERLASMAAMERIKGRGESRPLQFSAGGLIDSISELRECPGGPQMPRRAED